MDIDYLLALQSARDSLPGAIEQFFLWFSYVADGPALVALALIVYWCIDKRAGQLACFAFATGNFICQFMKNLFCIYRPWIRDTRVLPTADAIEGAGGYSFPSGHTNGAGTVLGSFAWSARKKHLWLSIVCVLCVLIIAFSRNYLGVHTPQDVLVGLCIAIMSIALASCFLRWIERYDALMPGHNKDIVAVVAICIACIASLVVLALKPYPLDYVDGELLVDPESMLKGSYEAVGAYMGMALGWLLERRFVGFSTAGLTVKNRIVRFVAGVAVAGLTYVVGGALFKLVLPYNIAKLVTLALLCILSLFAVPLLFKRLPNLFGDEEQGHGSSRSSRGAIRHAPTSNKFAESEDRDASAHVRVARNTDETRRRHHGEDATAPKGSTRSGRASRASMPERPSANAGNHARRRNG